MNVGEPEYITRLRCFQHWYTNAIDTSYATPELLDALPLLSDYDALKRERDEAERRLTEQGDTISQLRIDLAEAVALLREARADYAHAMNDAQIAASAGCNIIEFGLKLSEWLRKIAAIDDFLAKLEERK